MPSEPLAHPLALRRRLVLSGDGTSAVETIALCPRRGEVPASECLVCDHFGGADDDDLERCAFVLCRVAPPANEDAFEPPTAGDRTPISAVMTTDVFCVREDVRIDALGALFLDNHISGVPVVDDEGFPIGVVSKTDLLRACRTRGPCEPRVGDIMMPLAFTLYESAPLSQAAALMAFEGVHRLPVVSAAGTVVGIVTSLDIMRWLATHDGYLTHEPPSAARTA